jgi:steroid delta-isomerase-like uncharacterized protein
MLDDAHHLTGRIVVAWNSHDTEAVVALHAPEGIVEDVSSSPWLGRDAIAVRTRMYLSGLPDLHLSTARAVGDRWTVAYEWRVTGTHRGPLLGLAPSGRTVDLVGVSLLDLDRDGLIASETLYWNPAALRHQIR